jgi:hypothetical protein
MNYKKILIYWFLSLYLCSCGDNSPASSIPYVTINKVIDLNNLPYQRLQFDNGYVYENGGYRGLIIYRKSAGNYYVYERACTYAPLKNCEVVEADVSGFFLKDDCCKSQFDWEGRPLSGVARFDLLRYRTSLSGSLLYITN